MRFTLALVISAVIAPLVASAPTGFEVENPVAIIEDSNKSQLDLPASPGTELYRREASNMYYFSLHRKEAHALGSLISEFYDLFKNDYFDYRQFERKKNQWNTELFRFNNTVKSQLSGDYSLDAYIDFAERQFEYMNKASEVNTRLENGNESGLEYLYNILELRANLGSFYLWDYAIRRIENIDAKIERKQEEYEEWIQDVKEDTEIPNIIRASFDTYSADVAKLLQDLKEKAAKRVAERDDDEEN